jgi:hypothetical protein
MSRSIYNENVESRVINPRSGFSQFVDLSNNQTISGIKRFLNNFITNSNVNFNRTDNIGRVVIQPNNYAGTFMGIYTDSEDTGTGWIYDTNGDFFYQTGGVFNNIQWKLDAQGNLNIVGNLDCDGNTTLETLTLNGVLTANNNIIMLSSKYLQTNLIRPVTSAGFQTSIMMDNRFIDTNVSSLDLRGQYIGISHPSQSLNTSIKMFYIAPATTGNFEIFINNIANKIMSTDWATLSNKTQWRWNFHSTADVLKIFIDPNATGTNPFLSTGSGKIACGALSCTGIDTTSGLITTGNIDVTGNITMVNPANATLKTTSVTSLECNGGNITGAGSITCNSLNAQSGLITTTGNITGATITGTSLNLVSGQIDCGIINNTTLNTSGTITTNNINPYSASTISSTGIWNYKSGSNINILLDAITTTSYRLKIYGVSAGTKFLYYSINDVLGLYNTATGTTIWSIGSTGIINTTDLITTTTSISAGTTITASGLLTCGSLQSNGATKIGSQNGAINLCLEIYHGTGSLYTGASFLICRNNNNLDIGGFSQTSQTTIRMNADSAELTGTLYTNKIAPYSGSVINIQPTSNFNFLKSAGVNRIVFNPSSTTGDILQIYRTGSDVAANSFLFFNNSGSFGIYDGTISKWNIDINGVSSFNGTTVTSLALTGGNITGCGSITATSLNLVSGQIDCGIINNTTLNTSGTITTNNINPYSASTISSTGIWNFKSGSNINILLDPIITLGNRLKVYGVSAGTKFLYYSTNDVLALFNTGTGNIWSIGSTGIISTTDYISTTSELRASSHVVCGDTVFTNKIAPENGTVINIQPTTNFNFLKSAGVNRIVFGPSTTSGDIIQIYRTGSDVPSNSFIYFNNAGSFGIYDGTVSKWNIDINGVASFTSLTCGIINATNILNLKNGSATPIILNQITTSGNRLQITPTIGGMEYLLFDTTGKLAYWDSDAGIFRWSISSNGDAILESLNCESDISCDNIISNGISGDTLNLKTGSVSTILLDGFTSSGYRLQIYGVASGIKFLYYTLTNNLGLYNSSTSTIIWQITEAGNISTIGSISSDTFQAKTTNTYLNKIEMSNEYANPDVGEIDIISQYIAVVHPSNTLSGTAKYGFFRTFSDGNIDFNINNISGTVWGTDWSNRLFYTDYTFQCRKSSFVSSYKYQKFMNGATEIGSILMLTASTVAFNSSSDYRLKQDIVPIKNPLERLMKLQPKNYRYIADVEDCDCCDCYFDGFIAHEIQEIYPMCVTGVKDDPEQMQQIDYSKLTPICVGSIQELNNKVDKMQELIDSQKLTIDTQQLLIQNLIERLDILESK